MLKNYFKTAWRNLLKNKFYSLLNLAGLTAGLAIGILILLWVQDELSFDSFHKQTSDIYRLELFGGTGASRQIWSVTTGSIGPMAKAQLPDVRDQVRITSNDFYSLFQYQDKSFGDENAVFTDPSLFSIFDFPLVKGNPAKPFTDDNSVVITKKTAKKYFGDQDPMGKVIVADKQTSFTVTGVINDFPKNSSLNVGMIMPMSHRAKKLLQNKMDISTDFEYYNYVTFLLLKPGTSLKSLTQKLVQIHLKNKPEDTDAEYLLLPLSKMHLYRADGSNAGMETVRIFIIVALLILVIACINYVNLSTARSMLRAKEISMRKVVGAAKWQLFLQFIIESVLLFSLVTVFALGLIYMLLPLFNQVSGKELVFDLSNPHIWLLVGISIAATLAASSIYPALLLSSFEPLKAMKGKLTLGIGDAIFRKILVVTQFMFSVALIISTQVNSRQLTYSRSKELGYDRSHIFSFWMRDMSPAYDAAKSEISKQPGVLAVTRASGNLLQMGGVTGETDWDGKGANQTFIVHPMAIDYNFISFFKMNFILGSGFTGAQTDSTHFILNQAAVREIGLKNPIGKRFKMGGTNGTIVGVLKDFHFASLKEKIGPAVFYYRRADLSRIYIKTAGVDPAPAIGAAGSEFKQYNGAYPFAYTFLEDSFNSMYQSEQQEGSLFNYFATIAIGISCLGLLGLAAYTAQVRTREIGVRKVLGASVTGIIRLLAQDFIKLVLIAIVIAIPIAWYAMNTWLLGFAYRIKLGWTLFAIGGLTAIGIAFITISFQSVKAALGNPVAALKTE